MSTNAQTTATEILMKLHTQVIDAVRGYEDAEKATSQADIGALCIDLRHVHVRHAHELAGSLAELGQRPDSDGSFMSLVHKAVISARVSLTADDTSILPGLRDGEKRIVAAYDDALCEAEINPTELGGHIDLLRRQRAAAVENVTKIDAVMKLTT